jgi:hypothetical protein
MKGLVDDSGDDVSRQDASNPSKDYKKTMLMDAETMVVAVIVLHKQTGVYVMWFYVHRDTRNANQIPRLKFCQRFESLTRFRPYYHRYHHRHHDFEVLMLLWNLQLSFV